MILPFLQPCVQGLRRRWRNMTPPSFPSADAIVGITRRG